MKFCILLLLLLFSVKHSVSQSADKIYSIDFEKKNGTKGIRSVQSIMAPEKISEDYFFKGIPALYNTYSISKIELNYNKKKHQDYLDGKINHDEYIDYINKFYVDTIFLANSSNDHYFYVYSALDKINKKKILIPDCNNNYDFSDDSIFVFNVKDYKLVAYSEEQSQLYPEISVEKNNSQMVSILINPFDTFYSKNKYASEDEYFLDFVWLTNSYFEGYILLNDKLINIIEHKQNIKDLISENLTPRSFFRFFEEDSINEPLSYQIGDTLLLANRKVLVQSVDKLRLHLKDLGESYQDNILSEVWSRGVGENQKIYLRDLIKDKYVFIDFWGSWCNPCIASIPKLKDMYSIIKNREDALLLGIALENPKDDGKLQHVINENDVEWLNVWNSFSEMKSLSSPHGIFGIERFPTYMILDKNGRILYNSNSKDDAVDLFIKLINGNE